MPHASAPSHTTQALMLRSTQSVPLLPLFVPLRQQPLHPTPQPLSSPWTSEVTRPTATTPSLCLLGCTVTLLISSHKSLPPVLSSFWKLSLTPCHLSTSCGGQRSRQHGRGLPFPSREMGTDWPPIPLLPYWVFICTPPIAPFPNLPFSLPREFWAP